MNNYSARKLVETTSKFYAKCASEFSATRQVGWPGWERCAEAMKIELFAGCLDCASEATKQSTKNVIGTSLSCETLQILDVACGNLRFEKWLGCEFPDVNFRAHAVDTCAELLPDDKPKNVSFTSFNIASWLLDVSINGASNPESAQESLEYKNALRNDISTDRHNFNVGDANIDNNSKNNFALQFPFTQLKSNNIAVCFGFMHHIPNASARVRLICSLLSSVHMGGYVAISFWCFSRNEKMLKRAEKSTKAGLEYLQNERQSEFENKKRSKIGDNRDNNIELSNAESEQIQLDSSDYLLGFGDSTDIYRYCHNFTNSEIDNMLEIVNEQIPFYVIARFSSDGRGNNLNEYVVLQRK